MNDRDVLDHINQLVAEEHRLLERGDDDGLDDEDRQRLDAVQVSLDQCWDLLRQRRAHREFGQNPDRAHVRPAKVVEHYQQ